MTSHDSQHEPTNRQQVAEWFDRSLALIEQIRDTQTDAILQTAQLCAEAISAGGLVHLFGTGHSRIALEEMFPRYGSYPGWHPMAELSMTFHTQVVGDNGQRQAMFIERVQGLGEVILGNFSFGPKDIMIVFSSGGTTAVPIEVAIGAKQRGLPVIAVTAVDHSMATTVTHPTGTRLLDNADIVIDLGIPVGDSMIEISGVTTRVAPGSTIANATIVNAIKTATAALLDARNALPPVISSSSVVGKDVSADLFEAAYADHARRMARALTGDT